VLGGERRLRIPEDEVDVDRVGGPVAAAAGDGDADDREPDPDVVEPAVDAD